MPLATRFGGLQRARLGIPENDGHYLNSLFHGRHTIVILFRTHRLGCINPTVNQHQRADQWQTDVRLTWSVPVYNSLMND